MNINWFNSILKPKKVDSIKAQEEQEIIDLIDLLWEKIDTPSHATDIKLKIKNFKQYSISKKINSLPELYLSIEKHLTEKNKTNFISSQSIRAQLWDRYPFIQRLKNFRIIFTPIPEQELVICKLFLFQILEKSSELVGTYNDPEIMHIKQYLSDDTQLHGIDLIKERKKLLDFSNEIFNKIKSSLGINAITNIYLLIYKKHFQSYHLLDSFTATLNVIPEELLSKDLINFPSKQQMLKMLQKQLYSLEEINERLTKEVIERKNVEEELKHSEHLKTTILETAMDGIILVNSDGIVLNWNRKAEEILEVQREETIGHSIYPLVPRKLRQELKQSFSNYIRTGKDDLINKRVETSVNRRNGSIVYVELTIIAIESKGDYLFNAFFRDITNRKTRDNEIREAKVIAEKSTKAKSVFLSNMSHEIRTPLNVILGLTSILQKSNFTNPEIDKKNLNGIQFSAENLLILINDILDFSKIEAGKLSIHTTDFNILRLISNISRGFKIKAEEKGLKFITKIDPTIPKFIIGDQLRLNQILINLIGNAIKFTQEGKVIFKISTEQTDDQHIAIKFLVKDTGMGIPEDKLINIFESFYQVHKPGKNKIEGTGLGLSISKQLIEIQGGKLRAKSELGKGSKFYFSIKYRKSDFKSVDIDTDDLSIKKRNNLSGTKILVVEDNKMNQFFIEQLLSNWNIEVHTADNGKIALKKLKSFVYDLILMDMHMPVMNGTEAAKKIRKSKNPAINKIPIIACSADVFPESKKKAIKSGMNFYLTKPISEQALEELLLSVLDMDSENKLPIAETNDTSTIKDNKVNQEPKKSSETLCDLSFLRKTFDNDIEIIRSVLEMFVEETPKDYEKLKNVIFNSNMDYTLIKEIAHKLKSSFRTVGLQNESVILEKIETASREQAAPDTLIHHFNRLNDLYPQIITEIKQSVMTLSATNP